MESSIEFLETSSLRAVSETAAPASEKGMSEEMTKDEQGQEVASEEEPTKSKTGKSCLRGIQPKVWAWTATHCNDDEVRAKRQVDNRS